MWNVKTKVIPVIISATGTMSKSFRKCVSNIPRNHEVKELQKTAILTLRRLMSYIYGAPILDVSRSHTTTQHSR